MTTRLIKGKDLEVGMVIESPFGRMSHVTEVKLGREFMNFRTVEGGKSRMGIYDEVFVEVPTEVTDPDKPKK